MNYEFFSLLPLGEGLGMRACESKEAIFLCSVEIGVRPDAILRSCLTLSCNKISSASICIHQPQRSITRRAEKFRNIDYQKSQNRRPDPAFDFAPHSILKSRSQ